MKKHFSDDELGRAREITRAVRSSDDISPEMRDLVGNPPNRFIHVFLGIVVIAAVVATGWYFFAIDRTAHAGAFAESAAREAALPSNDVQLSKPSRSPSSSVVYQSKPQTSSLAARPPAPSKSTNSYVSRTIKPTTNPNIARPSAPTTTHAFDVGSHQAYAAKHAENYFRHKYVLGSADLRIEAVEITPKETNRVPGWPHFRNVGNVLIKYYNPRTRAYGTTRRGYEATSEEISGQIELRDFTVKAQPYGT